MKKRWVWLVSGPLVAGIVGSAGWAAWQSQLGQRVVQHLDQTYNLTDAGRVMVARSDPGMRGDLWIFGGKEGYEARTRWAPHPGGTGYVLARVETTRPIKLPNQ